MRLQRIALVMLFLMSVRGAYCSVNPENIVVVVNDLSSVSQAVGAYYCNTAHIPLTNLIGVSTAPYEEISPSEFSILAGSIRNKLISQLHVDPLHPESDKIQVLVMCYGVPSRIMGDAGGITGEPTSVDSYLTLLFNRDPDLGPTDIDGDSNATSVPGCYLGDQGVHNPYSGKDIDFATFRASSDNTISYNGNTWKMRYLVCRLDGYDKLLVDVPGFGTMPKQVKDMIDRAAASSGQRGRFVLDEPWHYDNGGSYNNRYTTVAQDLRSLVDSSLVIHDGTESGSVPAQCILSSYTTDGTDSHSLSDSIGVMGYSSYGMHDLDIGQQTYWGRTDFNRMVITSLTSEQAFSHNADESPL